MGTEISEAATPSMTDQELKTTLSNHLFENAMRGDWDKVLETYKNKEESRDAKLTVSRDTALHLAVSGTKPKIVKAMVESLGKKASEILKLKNERGNTPLHTAAQLGDAYMCHCIASVDHSLMDETNNDSATPLFLAALFGHQEAFLCLHFLYEGNQSKKAKSREANGDTFLHAAIKGEFFCLAYQIIRKYPGLADKLNEEGYLPLHVLAKKPSAFKSGCRLGLFDRIIYRCITVEEVKEIENDPAAYLKRFQETKEPWYPLNYGTCAQFFHMLFGVVFYGWPLENIRPAKVSCFQADEEKGSNNKHDNGPAKVSCSQADDQENASNTKHEIRPAKVSCFQADHEEDAIITKYEKEEQDNNFKDRYVPPNYATIIQSLKFCINLMLIVLGLGFRGIRRIIVKKETHTMALQLLDELMEKTTQYKLNEGGGTVRTDITFDPSRTGAVQGVEGEGDNKKTMSPQQDENFGQHSPSRTEHNEGSSNKEVTAAPIDCFMKEYNIIGSVDSKISKYSVKMEFEKKKNGGQKKVETPFLIAAKMGITEMVQRILEKFPVSIQDFDADGKNVLLLAVENRQTHTFRFLIDRKIPLHESVFRQWDHQGNNALHLAAKYGEYRPWLIPGAALQMQWELKWYKFVKRSISKHLLIHYNNKNQTPKQIFTETHKSLVKDGSEWLTKTSESCSLVAALIATVAFATSATIPGGVKENSGIPIFHDEPAFSVFSISSLIALCFSVTALVFFLAILTSRFEEKDFTYELPWKLIIGLTALFTSITAILVSFCAGHFFELRDKLKFAAFPIYVATCLPVSFFAVAQLPLYFDLLRAIIKDIPQRSNKEFAQ